jgi:hypothetical protein
VTVRAVALRNLRNGKARDDARGVAQSAQARACTVGRAGRRTR